MNFGERLSATVADRGQLCVGIDPHGSLLELWDLPHSAEGVREFGLRVVELVADSVGIVKPQIAFFERHGSAGYAALEAVLAAARDAGLVVIADVKRGDLGSTVEAYGEAWLSPGSPLEVDAMTTVAYQGLGSLQSVLELARSADKGVFVLAATSNPEGFTTQSARRDDGRTVAQALVEEIGSLNELDGAAGSRLGSVGVVIGATVQLDDFAITPAALANTPILAPGVGQQGATAAELPGIFRAATANLIVNSSRALLVAGPDGIAEAVARQQEELAACLA